jgi:cell division transport system permease protein
MASSTPASELKALAGRFEAFEGVARVRVVTREQAWAELQRRAGEGQTFGEIKPNPLPDTVVVEFAPRAPTLVIETAAASMRKQPRVDSVQVELDWYRRMMALWQATLGLLAPLAATTALLVVLVVVGVVRALVTVDRGELRVLAHIGADADFVRRPFVYAGALTLGLASACCLGLVALARLFANPLLAEVGRAFGVEVGLAYPPWPLVLAFVAGCLLLGAAAGGLGRPELRPE